MTRTVAILALLITESAYCWSSDANAAPATTAEQAADLPQAWPAEVAPELRRIQRELGGSAVEQFPQLGAPAEDRRAPKSELRGDGAGRRIVGRGHVDVDLQTAAAMEALRDAASQLDIAANKLERFELYDQADGLRAQAQRFRLDARRMGGVEPTRPAASVPTPIPQLVPTPLEEPTRPLPE